MRESESEESTGGRVYLHEYDIATLTKQLSAAPEHRMDSNTTKHFAIQGKNKRWDNIIIQRRPTVLKFMWEADKSQKQRGITKKPEVQIKLVSLAGNSFCVKGKRTCFHLLYQS